VPRNLRIVTLNLWGLSPPLTRRLDLAARQLRALELDVVALQEVRPLHGIDGRTTADELADALGMTAHYAVAVSWDDGHFHGEPAGQEGLALLARERLTDLRVIRLPRVRTGEARILLSGRLHTTAGPIWIHTTHLHYRLDDGDAREEQVVVIEDTLRHTGRGNDDPPQILCGDFNACPESDEMRFLRGLHTIATRRTHFQDAWLRRHREPQLGDGPAQGITWSSDNEHTRPLRSLDLDRRIDYVYVTSRKRDGRGTVHDCQVVLTEREGEGEEAICASDHYGVFAEIQIEADATLPI
jgi:endonuclease/exonuclease/phosphatase family metal-dependent hydrolase